MNMKQAGEKQLDQKVNHQEDQTNTNIKTWSA
jgi:hypothetical protein